MDRVDLWKMLGVSLCTGIGGLDVAAEATGLVEIVGQVEIDDFCNRVLEKHWPNVKRLRDIREVVGDEFGEPGTIDLVVAGFPCQPVSTAGKRRGAADDRWLWEEVNRIIRRIRPTWCLLENVPGLISLGLDAVLDDLADAGYEAWPVVFPAAAVGAPHERERVFIIGHKLAVADAIGERCRGIADAARRNDGDGSAARWEEGAGGVEQSGEPIGPVDDASARGIRRGQASGCGGLASQPGQGTLAHSGSRQWQRSVRLSARRQPVPWQGSGSAVDGCGEAVADTHEHGRRWQERADAGDVDGATGAHADREGHPQRPAAECGRADGCGHVAYATDARLPFARCTGEHSDCTQAAAGMESEPQRCGEWQAQSRIRGGVDGFPSRMDRHLILSHRWPALPGEAQHEWEAPRTITGRQANRASRLKALGNAVVPQQVYPVLLAIAQTWLMEMQSA